MIEDELLSGIEEPDEHSAIARLIELGRQKSYVTIDDIMSFFPEAEQDVEQLEEAFSALLSAGIPFVEDTTTAEPTEDELVAVEATEAEPEIDLSLDDYLANIDTDDTIGLYLKEVSRVPLLTAEEGVKLAQRIERGRMAREELAKGNASPRRRTELRNLIEDGWAAREHLITANSRLVISVAKKYMGRGVPYASFLKTSRALHLELVLSALATFYEVITPAPPDKSSYHPPSAPSSRPRSRRSVSEHIGDRTHESEVYIRHERPCFQVAWDIGSCHLGRQARVPEA